MNNQHPSLPDPAYLALSRKLVLLCLLMVTTAIGSVALLRQTRLPILVLGFLLTDALMGLVAGFSVRWILPTKALVLRIGSTAAFVTGGLDLLGWFTGWGFGIDLLKAGRSRMDWWGVGQILLATGIAFLALYAWQSSPRTVPTSVQPAIPKRLPHARRKPQKRPNRAPKPEPASPAASQAIQPAPQAVTTQPVKPKRKRAHHSKPKLLLSGQEEHRCPYCLELIDPDDRRGVVECEICHTLHHADCWAITGACQVPHFTA